MRGLEEVVAALNAVAERLEAAADRLAEQTERAQVTVVEAEAARQKSEAEQKRAKEALGLLSLRTERAIARATAEAELAQREKRIRAALGREADYLAISFDAAEAAISEGLNEVLPELEQQIAEAQAKAEAEIEDAPAGYPLVTELDAPGYPLGWPLRERQSQRDAEPETNDD